MEAALGCGYSINDESFITDYYSPPSSIDNDLFYLEEEDEIESNNTVSSLFIEEINEDEIKPIPLKLMSIETTPPLTPLITRYLPDSLNMDLENMKINTNVTDITPTNWSPNNFLFPKTPTPTSMDRYLIEHRRSSIEVTNETSRLYSYMSPINGTSNSWSTFDDTKLNNSLFPRPTVNPIFPNINNQFNHSFKDPWFLSEILRQNNNNNISLSTTAQQILNGNNRPLRSEKIDIEVIKHLIQEANWKRQCGMKKEICVFCRNNGENELIYSSHSLKDPMGNVTCPILRAYQCPICGATGSQAHTIKYCQSTGDDHNRHIPTPYEKMLRMQTFGFDDNITSSIPSFLGQLGSPSSLYTNGWSDSYL